MTNNNDSVLEPYERIIAKEGAILAQRKILIEALSDVDAQLANIERAKTIIERIKNFNSEKNEP